MSDTSLFNKFGRNVPNGQIIFKEGEDGEQMYIIQEGSVKISRMIAGKEHILANNSSVSLVRGDTFEIVDIKGGPADPADMIVNFKGYVGNKSINTGEDRGYIINTSRDLWKNYSLNKKGLRYQVVVTYNEKNVGRLIVKLKKPAKLEKNRAQ